MINCDLAKLTTICVESRHFAATAPAFNLSHLHLAPPLVVRFAEIFGIVKTKSLDYRVAFFCAMLRLAVPVEHRFVTDGRMDRQTDTRRQLISALSSVARVKMARVTVITPIWGLFVITKLILDMTYLCAKFEYLSCYK